MFLEVELPRSSPYLLRCRQKLTPRLMPSPLMALVGHPVSWFPGQLREYLAILSIFDFPQEYAGE